jgi:hypothetical protein
MRRVIVRYKVKPERVEEHEALVRAVFADLARTAPEGFRYGAYKQPDGRSFVHVAFLAGAANPLDDSPAFQTFVERIRERCEEPPVAVDLAEVGAYGL